MAVIRAEQSGWLMSGALHVGVAVVALIGLPQLQRPLPDLPPPIAIEFVQIAEQTRVVEPEPPKAEPQQAQSEPQPQYAAAEAVPEAPADAAPTLEQVKVVDTPPPPKPKPKPQVSENRQLANRVVPRAKPRPPSRLKSNRIAALIDRSIKEEQQETQRRDEEKHQAAEKEPEKKPSVFSGLRGRLATASVMDALRQKVESNWSFPGGAKDIQDMRVTIRIWIRPDGYYSRSPEFIGVGNLNDPDRAFFRIFAESARRAVLLSEPLDEAAKNLDANTSYIDFEFNPASFVGQ